MKTDAKLRRQFREDPITVIEGEDLSDEDKAILLSGERELIAEAFSTEAVALARYWARTPTAKQAAMVMAPGPWIFERQERTGWHWDPDIGQRGSSARLTVYGVGFRRSYRRVELRGPMTIAGTVSPVGFDGPNASVTATFDLRNARVGLYSAWADAGRNGQMINLQLSYRIEVRRAAPLKRAVAPKQKQTAPR
jgi:hypothetical protein